MAYSLQNSSKVQSIPLIGDSVVISGKKGFTILELMIVITVMGILAAIAVPNFQTFMAQRRLNGAARMVMSDMMSARMQAVTHNNNFQVFFLDANRYQILDDDNNNGVADSGEASQIINIQTTYSGVTMISTNNPIFSPKGTAANWATITLSNSSGSRKVMVAITGRARIE